MNRWNALALWGVATALYGETHGWSREFWGAMCVYWGIRYLVAAGKDAHKWWRKRRERKALEWACRVAHSKVGYR